MVFGFFESPSWTPEQIPDLTGRVAIVTGANTGIGYHTCLQLSRHGAKVYMACRSEPRTQEAISRIKEEVPNAELDFLQFDLTRLASAITAAETFAQKEGRLDILVNNAGIAMAPYELSPDGIEVQACNGTGHFALTTNLLPLLRKTSELEGSDVRIVTVASEAHKFTTSPDFSTLDGLNKPCLNSAVRYGNSKLSNMVFTQELQKRLDDTGIICISVHPGGVATEIPRSGLKAYPFLAPFLFIQNYVLMHAKDGAITSLYAATSPEVRSKQMKAEYLIPFGKIGTKNKLAEDKEGKLGREFWSLCEKLMAEAGARGDGTPNGTTT
ncbi:uncharacterized protein MELLADRAFT_71290 [Melampsora larici-populina 98AG31]|uniref:NAD(P)-binding protein n=1 Tax=Melampsora larici-populina (strain 98AG31 / pathotype 3-4-7) TaxID=747676 RepID=F4REE7_MELLP|nr:uncharacterized protein MELLADRAFT_71290 [Melampsora larici-populina 98AG31]EGG09078.1 hypothetical protein MELLADRAFT_71290 [Melampsora larici-populina 98AG31]